MTDTTTASNIRFLIDQRGFEFLDTPLRAPVDLIPSPGRLSIPMPGQQQIVIPGSTASTTPWGEIIRSTIDKALGTVFPDEFIGGPLMQRQGPVTDLPMVPDFIDRMLSGTLPRGAVSFIEMPNGTTGCPSGYHPEKSNKPYCVRNRRMNALNPRALSRASRRVGGFARAVKRARTLKRICKTL